MARSTATPVDATDEEVVTVTEGSSATFEAFLSSDGKHTVHVVGALADRDDLLAEARAAYDEIIDAYGMKPQYQRTSAPKSDSAGGSSSGGDRKVFKCADCGEVIKGFKDGQGKLVTAEKIATARKRNNGRVTCGKNGCKNAAEEDDLP